MRYAMILIIALFLAACDTDGAFIKPDAYEELKGSVSSAEELYEALGPPSVTIPRADGNQIWVYEGVYTQADATRYIPIVDILAGSNSQTCTRLTVVVNSADGSLSEWDYKSEKDQDYWAKTDDSCSDKRSGDASSE